MTKSFRFPWKWNIAGGRGYPSPGLSFHGSTVFSCFSGTGGSTMGYKLAGYNVLGCLEIDKRMMDVYKTNHHPVISVQDDINRFLKGPIDPRLFSLDVLDGSPPCSTFSMSGLREKDWGTLKHFTEGQAKQYLDELYFSFITLARRLQPKVIITENVSGLIKGSAHNYLTMILSEMKRAGYVPVWRLLEMDRMGLPQRRQRVFIIGIRNDLAISTDATLLTNTISFPPVEQGMKGVVYGDVLKDIVICDSDRAGARTFTDICKTYFGRTRPGESYAKHTATGSHFNWIKLSQHIVAPTICGVLLFAHPTEPRLLMSGELRAISTFPQDFDFIENNASKVCYFVGMSVPPAMMAHVAHSVWTHWLSRLKPTKPHFDFWPVERLKRAFIETDWTLPSGIGLPDLLHKQSKVAVFVDDCFWRDCGVCYKTTKVSSFWKTRIALHKERAALVDADKTKRGWRIIRWYEHELDTLKKIENKVKYLKGLVK